MLAFEIVSCSCVLESGHDAVTFSLLSKLGAFICGRLSGWKCLKCLAYDAKISVMQTEQSMLSNLIFKTCQN